MCLTTVLGHMLPNAVTRCVCSEILDTTKETRLPKTRCGFSSRDIVSVSIYKARRYFEEFFHSNFHHKLAFRSWTLFLSYIHIK